MTSNTNAGIIKSSRVSRRTARGRKENGKMLHGEVGKSERKNSRACEGPRKKRIFPMEKSGRSNGADVCLEQTKKKHLFSFCFPRLLISVTIRIDRRPNCVVESGHSFKLGFRSTFAFRYSARFVVSKRFVSPIFFCHRRLPPFRSFFLLYGGLVRLLLFLLFLPFSSGPFVSFCVSHQLGFYDSKTWR